MAKFIIKIFRFLVVALLLYIPLVIVWAEFDYNSFIRKNVWYELTQPGVVLPDGQINSYGHMFSRMKEVKTARNIDLLIIGASQAYRGFDTRNFEKAGYSSFNLGSSNQTPLQTEMLLKKYLGQLNPGTIIYVVYPEVFSADGVESTLDLIANDHVHIGMVALVLKQRNLKLFNTLIYAAYRDLFNLNKDFTEPVQKQNDQYIKGGYVERELLHYGYHHAEKNTWQFNRVQFRAFERSLKMINNQKIQLILVQTPTPKLVYSSQTNNAQFDTMMNNYGEYYNFNTLVELDDSIHFYDAYHMNQLGVEIFNDALIDLINEKTKSNDQH